MLSLENSNHKKNEHYKKSVRRSSQLLIELPNLNTALVEAYRDLDNTTHAAKQMARCCKIARKQAQRATELWQASKHRIVVLEKQLQDRQHLGPPRPYNPLSLNSSTPQPLVPHLIEASTQTDEVIQPTSNPVEVSTQTKTEPPPTINTTETQSPHHAQSPAPP